MGFFSYYDDEVWVIVNRTINGATKRYVEYFKPDQFEEQEDAYFVDCGVSADTAVTITAITQADPGVVTAGSHGFSNGDTVVIRGVVGMTEVNHTKYKVANKTDDTFELTDSDDEDVDTTGYTAYVSGGEVRSCSTAFSGLDHLEGETVSVLADSIVLGDEVVSSGAITLDVAGGQVHAGLPFTSTLKTMRMEAQLQTGTVQSKYKHINKMFIRLHESLGGNAGNPDSQDEINFGDYDSEFVSLFTGDKEIILPSSQDREGQVLIEQDDPLPMNILAIVSHVNINEP
jgi:hypothetical protein